MRPSPQRAQSVVMAAPIGGINTMDAGPTMPDLDALYLYNCLAAEYGLRSRLGYREWVTGLTGNVDNGVRTILPFVGDAANGADNRLFATTDSGIWDVSASTASPTQVVAFPSSAGSAGRGVSTVVATPGGRWLVYCDEENGLYIYKASTTTWAKATAGVTQPWLASTTVLVGDDVVNGGNIYTCTVAGVTASTGGPTGTGAAIADGTATWSYSGAASSGVFGTSLGDQQAGAEFDPAKAVFPVVWKSRLWLVERDTAFAWYLDTDSIYGTASRFNFGYRMRSGGPLVGLYNWTYDGGNGLDTLLAAISSAGDVVIYSGTDPSSASTFGLKGTWSVGGVPSGRDIAVSHGGDVLVLSQLGLVPLSKLVLGGQTEDAAIYATAKIANKFSQLAAERRILPGWGVHIHPTDNALIVLVPSYSGGPAEPLVMALATKAWSQYRDIPMVCGGVWAGEFYFGTAAGTVCWNTDYVDAVPLDRSTSTPVKCSILSAFRNLGNAQLKRVTMLRPTLLSSSTSPVVQAAARYDYDMTEPAAPPGTPSGGWDTGVWDSATWGSEYTAYRPIQGATGMGWDVAIAVRWSATSRTTLVDVGVWFELGGTI